MLARLVLKFDKVIDGKSISKTNLGSVGGSLSYIAA